MSEQDNKINSENNSYTSESDIDLLSKKYGISSQENIGSGNNSSHNFHGRTLARTPRIVYDINDPTSSVKIEYQVRQDTFGPESRRVIYAEQETESIAEKRRRNAGLQKTEKGSRGFGSQPYVKHVASSREAIKRDDEETFARAYNNKKTNNEAPAPVSETPLTESKDRLVALNPEAEKKRAHMHYEKSGAEKVKGFFRSFLPWKGDPAKEVFRKLIMDLSAILVFICFGFFIDNYLQHQNALDNKEQLKGEIITNGHETATDDDNLEEKWAEIKAKYPNVTFPEGMNIKWAELYAKNQDLIGWLKIDNTNIDTPVMHKPSDRETNAQDFYLRKSFYKKYDKYGTPYLEKFNSGATLDKNNTIYGHNMMDGLSFAQLEKYYTIDGFKESPIIQYSTLYNDYNFKVYAVIITNGYPSGDNGYLFNYNISYFGALRNFETFIEALDERKLYDTGVDINKNDKLITLSTCSYEIKQGEMGRLAVIGRLVREGESISVDTSKAVLNENVRYPQIWYDEHNMRNPFAGAYQWIPE